MRLYFLSHGSYLLSFTCLVFGISITWFSTSRRPVQCWESCLLSIQGTYGYICYFHIKININILTCILNYSRPPAPLMCLRNRIEGFWGSGAVNPGWIMRGVIS